jgi:uncharacterized protein YndB with AHSA1/START domain
LTTSTPGFATMDEPGLEINRVFDAPREEVWREWTEPDRFADWYGGPEADNPLESVSMDVRPGGDWHLTMYFGPERREIRWHGTYREVVEPERLVFTITDRPEDDPDELVTVALTDLGDGRTEMLMTQTGGGLSPEGYERAKQGWGKFFDALQHRLVS